jgi:hypothetical protein
MGTLHAATHVYQVPRLSTNPDSRWPDAVMWHGRFLFANITSHYHHGALYGATAPLSGSSMRVSDDSTGLVTKVAVPMPVARFAANDE